MKSGGRRRRGEGKQRKGKRATKTSLKSKTWGHVHCHGFREPGGRRKLRLTLLGSFMSHQRLCLTRAQSSWHPTRVSAPPRHRKTMHRLAVIHSRVPGRDKASPDIRAAAAGPTRAPQQATPQWVHHLLQTPAEPCCLRPPRPSPTHPDHCFHHPTEPTPHPNDQRDYCL